MNNQSELIYRKAVIPDAKKMQTIINQHAGNDEMLPRSLNHIYENIRDFIVCEIDGEVRGCCALHVMWEDLAEIKSVAIEKQYQGLRIGTELVNRSLEEARNLGLPKVFLLTYKPDFFKKFGFEIVDKNSLPHKVWTECINCPKFPDCGETAMSMKI